MKKIFLGLIATVCAVSVFAGAGDWAWQGVVAADPTHAITRLAVDSNETLYYADGNANPQMLKWTNFPTCRANIGTYNAPVTVALDSATGGNGFQCVSVDDSDNVFSVYESGVDAADQSANWGWVKKFDSAGTEQWNVAKQTRYSNGDIMSDGNLFVISHGGDTQVYASADGAASAATFSTADTFFRGTSIDKATDNIYVMKSGTLNRIVGTAIAPFGAGTWADSSWQVGPSCDFFAADNSVIAADETSVHVIDAATGDELQIITKLNDTTNFDGVNYKPRGVVAYTVGSTDYLIVSCYGTAAVIVYSKQNSSPVNDWTLLDK